MKITNIYKLTRKDYFPRILFKDFSQYKYFFPDFFPDISLTSDNNQADSLTLSKIHLVSLYTSVWQIQSQAFSGDTILNSPLSSDDHHLMARPV